MGAPTAGCKVKVYTPDPPEGVELIEPLQSPLQVGDVIVALAVMGSGSVISTVAAVGHRFASRTFSVYVPWHKAVMLFVPCPSGFPGDQVKVYGVVPPVTLATAEPLQTPLQARSVFVMFTTVAGGWVMAVVLVNTQPTASVTEKEYTPAQSPFTTEPLPKDGVHEKL